MIGTRQKWQKLFLAFLIACLAFFFGPQVVKAYDITQYKGHLTIKEDNSATFDQELHYQYEDSYNGQYVTLGMAGDLPPNFAIQADQIQYRVYKNDALVSSNYPGELEQSRQVAIEYMGDGYRLKVYNAVQDGDRVKIQVRWPLQNMLYPYQDIAELKWLPISDWDIPLYNIDFRITAPAYDKGQMAVHTGYLREAAQVEQDGQDYLVRLGRLGSGKKLEFHGYWSREILSAVDTQTIIPEDGLPAYQATEANIKKYSQLMERVTYLWLPLAAAVALVLDGLRWTVFRRKVDLRTKMLKNSRLYEVPSSLNPMQVTRAIYNTELEVINPANPQPSRMDFDHLAQATILDLIDRGNLVIEEQGEEPLLVYQSSQGLSEAESAFLNMAFSGQKELAMDQLFSDFSAENHVLASRSRSKQTAIRASGKNLLKRYNQAFEGLSDALDRDLNRLNLPVYYRPFQSREGAQLFTIGLPSVAVGLTIFLFYLYLLTRFSTHSWVLLGLSGLMAIAILTLYSKKSSLKRDGLLTEAGLEQYQLWEAFKNMLRDIGRFDKTELEAVVLWNRLLVYATLFGYAKEVSRVLEINDIQLDNPSLNAYVYRGYSPFLSARTGSFSQDVHTARQASNFSVSSGSSSSGGGFSSGGFSGGGGGGGSF
ncbi:putative membrane protein YgcG [Streptococcus rupicaprae]|uniref:Membrane protein YgcG n=1 Tax=Streptococcus rupicaprae TaxID=759619 RepID=A0ABV2FI89_9STRE